MSTPRKVAIIGAGIGEQHLAAYRNLPERFEVAALCDLDLQRAESIAGDDPSLELTDDFQSVLNDPEIELIAADLGRRSTNDLGNRRLYRAAQICRRGP